MHYTTIAGQYAEDVVEGRISACLHVKRACQRFIDDIGKSGDPEFGYFYDVEEAERWCRFLEKLPHVKGVWAKREELLKLSPWQIFIVTNLFGWRRNGTELRRFREAYVECPRKQGKSALLAGIGLGMLAIDGEHAAEVYSGATNEAQAWFVFGQARLMAKQKRAFRNRFNIEVHAKSVSSSKTASSFKTVIGKPGDGASSSCAIADEFHEHKDSDQVDTFITGMGARAQPLMLYITTAGSDVGGPCYAKRDDVVKILEGVVEDETIFGTIYGIDPEDRWDTEEAIIKANPNLGVSVDFDFLKGQLAKAKRTPVAQAAYKTKHLDVWVGSRAPWMNLLKLQRCQREIKIQDYKGRKCFVGLDLASRKDLTSMAVVFPPEGNEPWAAFLRNWVPEERIIEGEGTRYKGWHAEGWIEATDGNVTDYSVIEAALKEVASTFQVEEIDFDPYQATQLSTRMIEEGLPMVQYGATVKNFSEPMKTLDTMIDRKEILFQHDPVLFWCFSNVTARKDLKDNIFPTKEREENKIDSVVALIMAFARAMVAQPKGTVYDDRGIVST